MLLAFWFVSYIRLVRSRLENKKSDFMAYDIYGVTCLVFFFSLCYILRDRDYLSRFYFFCAIFGETGTSS